MLFKPVKLEDLKLSDDTYRLVTQELKNAQIPSPHYIDDVCNLGKFGFRLLDSTSLVELVSVLADCGRFFGDSHD